MKVFDFSSYRSIDCGEQEDSGIHSSHNIRSASRYHSCAGGIVSASLEEQICTIP